MVEGSSPSVPAISPFSSTVERRPEEASVLGSTPREDTISLSSIKVMHPPCKWENSGQYRGWAPAYQGVAQLVARIAWDDEGVGSSPTTLTRTLKIVGMV